MAHVKNTKEPTVAAGDRPRERIGEKVREEMEGPSFVAIVWMIVFTLRKMGS